MKVNEKYMQTMYIAFGQGAGNIIRCCIENIIIMLESMSTSNRAYFFAILDPEVRNAIIGD